MPEHCAGVANGARCRGGSETAPLWCDGVEVMMRDPERSDNELTLEVTGSSVSPAKFLAGCRAFFGLVNEVSTEETGGKRIAWTVQVHEGSNLVALTPRPGYPTVTIESIKRKVRTGVRTLETGSPVPESFSEPAIRYLQQLGNIAGRTKDDDTRVRVWVKHKAEPVSQKTAAHAAELLGWNYQDYGSVEGRLEVVSAHRGLVFMIYEPLWNKPIRCQIGDELLDTAMSNFRRRVEVYGTVQYRKDGTPISVAAQEIVPFPSCAGLPNFRQLRGVLKQT